MATLVAAPEPQTAPKMALATAVAIINPPLSCPIITDEVKELIRRFKRRHQTWTAKIIQEKVSSLLHKADPKLPPNWPGLNAVQKVLAEEKGLDPQDQPWSAASIERYPIDREALPVVLKLGLYRLSKYKHELTIREAKWASRLSAMHKTVTNAWAEKAAVMEKLSLLSFAYAYNDKVSQDLGESFIPSMGLDVMFFESEDTEWPQEFTDLKAIIMLAYNTFVKGEDNEGTHNQKG